MKKWEYKLLPIEQGATESTDHQRQRIDAELTALGLEGWRVINVCASDFLLEREIPEPESPPKHPRGAL